MESPHQVLTVEDCRMALTTAHFDKEYEKTFGRTAQLLEAERGRVRCMDNLLLQFENESLRLKLDQLNKELAKTTRSESDVHHQLYDACKEVDRLQKIAHVSAHEIEDLRHQIASLSNATIESQKLVEDKIRLSKDLSNIQSELERFKSQSTSSHNLLAEKQALGRQVNTLEVQLESEKRTHERLQARVTNQAEEITTLTSKLEEAQKELSEQVQIRERQERSVHQQSLEWGAQRAALESKLETLNRKLRSLKDQLQEAQSAPQQRPNYKASEASDPTARTRTVPLHRPTSQFNPDLTIATPGAVQTHDRSKKPSALPGDKSSFSITPFLNRTSGLQDSSASSEDDMDELHAVSVNDDSKISLPTSNVVIGTKNIKPQQQDQVMLSRGQPRSIEHQQSDKVVKVGKGKATKLFSRQPNLEDLAEDVNDLSTDLSGLGQAKTKKRKLGAQRDRNLFEEDEDQDIRDIRQPGLKLGRNALSSNLPRSHGFGGVVGFSPLKRDRKRP